MEINRNQEFCTVVVIVQGKAEDIAEVRDHAAQGPELFSGFDGFIAGATHMSEDGGRIIQYLQWRSKADHEACMAHPSWNEQESSRRFMEKMRGGALQVDVGIYDVIACANR